MRERTGMASRRGQEKGTGEKREVGIPPMTTGGGGTAREREQAGERGNSGKEW